MPTLTKAADQNYQTSWYDQYWAPPYTKEWIPGISPNLGLVGNTYDNDQENRAGTGLHFTLGTTILQGSTINAAPLTITPRTWTHTITFYIKAELAASPDVMASNADLIARRGLTAVGGVPGVNDAGLVTVALLDEVNVLWTNGTPVVYDIAPLIQELATAFNITKIEVFVDDFNNRSADYD